MLKKKVKAIYAEIGEEYNLSEKKAIVSYILMDTDEQKRINLPKIPLEFQVSLRLWDIINDVTLQGRFFF